MPRFAVPHAHAGVNPTTWEHEDFKITKPDLLKEASPIGIFKAALTMHFDGGYKHKIGTAGYIVGIVKESVLMDVACATKMYLGR